MVTKADAKYTLLAAALGSQLVPAGLVSGHNDVVISKYIAMKFVMKRHSI